MSDNYYHTTSLTIERQQYSILRSRMQQTSVGPSWRFISHSNLTVQVFPFLSRAEFHVSPPGGPDIIDSAFSGLAILAYNVLAAYEPQEGSPEYEELSVGKWGNYASAKLANHDREAEEIAFRLIEKSNTLWGGPKLSKAKLRDLRDALFEIGRKNEDYPNCTHWDLMYVIDRWKEIANYDPKKGILLSYGSGLTKTMHQIAEELSADEGCSLEEAISSIVKQVRYITNYFGRPRENDGFIESPTLIKSYKEDVWDEVDYELVKDLVLGDTQPQKDVPADSAIPRDAMKVFEYRPNYMEFVWKGKIYKLGRASVLARIVEELHKPWLTGHAMKELHGRTLYACNGIGSARIDQYFSTSIIGRELRGDGVISGSGDGYWKLNLEGMESKGIKSDTTS